MSTNQKVYVSHTVSGIKGIFTNGFLVMELNDEQLQSPHLKELCEEWGFELVEAPRTEWGLEYANPD